MKKRNKKTEHFDLKSQYRESWEFVKESKNFIYIIIGIFFFFALIGFIIPVPEIIKIQIIKFMQDLLKKTEGLSTIDLISFIFLNNLQASFFGIILGILFGVFPLFFAIINGYILGFVASISVENQGFFILWRLFPHGIFELPAVFISLGLGLRLGTLIFKKKKISLRNYFLNSLKVFLFIIAPLIIIAGIIEGVLISLG